MERTVYAQARYEDCQAAIDFLTSAFGFQVHEASKNDEGKVHHAELLVGNDMIMIGEGRPGGPGIYVAVGDVDAHHDRAKAAGAAITMELVDQPYGSREYGCTDPQGNTWWFGTYRP
ncbi:putative glyoxalase superfamily protein PhnB [Nonomuraea polychroma]|uniref:Putative glyoxalase superfamily protein PhnB n=1 Tax=Nonomuraea polychroma TaxID=46176 RepID=A0A438MDL2_9ACTN|nr:VOC family protein [Nonomuraea polychroma]RVX43631.1 putative glyoxalase superfamily protein PhnB [Nonomuraea polychroma]